jgi:hypothetical protein
LASLPGEALVLALEDGSKYLALTKNGIEIKGNVTLSQGTPSFPSGTSTMLALNATCASGRMKIKHMF